MNERLRQEMDRFKAMRENSYAEWLVDPDGHHERGDLMPVVTIFNGEFPTLTMFTSSRDEALWAAGVAMMGFHGDELVLCIDAHLTRADNLDNPPEPGELQRRCHEEGACETGEITDCLVVHVMRAPDDGEMLIAEYRLGTTELIWGEEHETPVTKLSGIIVDGLRHAFKMAELDIVEVMQNELGISPADCNIFENEDVVYHTMMGCVQAIVREGIGLVISGPEGQLDQTMEAFRQRGMDAFNLFDEKAP